MIKMKRSSSLFLLGSEFEPFLLAPIGEDNNGMVLTVLSALARLNVDPWEVSATLARLPGDTATRKLASLIAALPNRAQAITDSATIAARLITLLPNRAGSELPSQATGHGSGAMTRSPILTSLVLYIIFMFFMLVSHWLAASLQAPVQPNSNTGPPASAGDPPNTAGRTAELTASW
ncbi:MAG: hypothetical protein WB646_16930 [Steroidobacteraceae bacterium]